MSAKTNYDSFTPKMLEAFKKTVHAYETLIWTLENGTVANKETECKKWSYYSESEFCNLCNATIHFMDCDKCILNGPILKNFPCVHSTMNDLDEALVFGPDKRILKAAKARLAWILTRAEKNGMAI